MAKKKLPLSIFEIVWYSICALVIIWGLVYVILSLVEKYNDLSSLHTFANGFKETFGLTLYFWGLIIIAIGVVAGVFVMILSAKTFDRAADREQRRSARLSVLNKKEDKVVSEQQPEIVDAPENTEPVQQEEVKEQQPAQNVEAAPSEELKAEQPVAEESKEIPENPETPEAPLEEKAE